MYTGIPQASWAGGFVADVVADVVNLFHFGSRSLGLASCIYPSTLYVVFSSVAYLSSAYLRIAPKLDP